MHNSWFPIYIYIYSPLKWFFSNSTSFPVYSESFSYQWWWDVGERNHHHHQRVPWCPWSRAARRRHPWQLLPAVSPSCLSEHHALRSNVTALERLRSLRQRSPLKHRSCSHINISMKQLTLHTARYPWESPTERNAGGHLWTCGRRNWEWVHSDGHADDEMRSDVWKWHHRVTVDISETNDVIKRLRWSAAVSTRKQQKTEEK